MGYESTIICVDNSDYMRNGDFLPSRLGAQQDAVNLICHAKSRQNPENTVGLVTLVSGQVLITLTQDVGRVLAKLHEVQPNGTIRFISAVRVAQLALKHRLGKNHRQRIVIFIGSPVEDDEKELVKLAKRLKKENVNVDIINFGEDSINTDKLTKFIDTLNGSNSTSHLVTVPPGPMLSDALLSSPVVAGEDGQPAVPGFGREFGELGIDPNEDPELALALRVSLEEQRVRQEAEARRAAAQALPPGETATPAASNEEAMLQSALGMPSVQATPLLPAAPASAMGASGYPDFASMTEDEQIAYALHMSLAEQENTNTLMETEEVSERHGAPTAAVAGAAAAQQRVGPQSAEEDYSDVMSDPEFLQNVLENLPGVDPQSEEIRNAMSQLSKKDEKKDEKKPSK